MLLEAVGTGVLRRSTIGTYAQRLEWIRVLRPKRPLTPNSQGLEIRDCAETSYGRAYGYRGALASRFPVFSAASEDGVFCSQVVAQAYLLYGVCLLPGRRPSEIFPGMLLDSPELSDVTDSCIRNLGSVSDVEAYNLVVKTASQKLPIDEMRMNRRTFDAIRKELGGALPESIRSLTELTIWLSAEFHSDLAKQSDPIILKILEREGMFEWHDQFRRNARWHITVYEWAADGFEASAHYPMSSEIEAFLPNLTDTDDLRRSSLQGRRATSQEYRYLANKTGLKIFERLSAIYREQYQDAERVHRAIDRMIDALKQRPSA